MVGCHENLQFNFFVKFDDIKISAVRGQTFAENWAHLIMVDFFYKKILLQTSNSRIVANFVART